MDNIKWIPLITNLKTLRKKKRQLNIFRRKYLFVRKTCKENNCFVFHLFHKFSRCNQYSNEKCQFQCQTVWDKIPPFTYLHCLSSSFPSCKLRKVIVFTFVGIKRVPIAWHRVSITKWKILLLLFSTAYKISSEKKYQYSSCL